MYDSKDDGGLRELENTEPQTVLSEDNNSDYDFHIP